MASASAGGGNPGHQAIAAAALLSRRAAAAASGDNGNNKSAAFSLTCTRLSQYLKEKGTVSLGGIGFQMPRTVDAAAANKGTSRPETPRTMNLLPGIDSSNAADSPTEKQQLLPTSATAAPAPPPRGAQMTIFYGGKVIVFDNYPADKAREILALAGRGTAPTPPKAQGPAVVPPLPKNCATASAAAGANNTLPLPVKPATTPAGVAPAAETLSATVAPAPAAPPVSQKPPAIPLASDLPIARRVSLNRFLEKRKDRINSKAPYPPVNTAGASSSDGKPTSDKDKQPPRPPMPLLDRDNHHSQQQQPQQSWLGLAPSESL